MNYSNGNCGYSSFSPSYSILEGMISSYSSSSNYQSGSNTSYGVKNA